MNRKLILLAALVGGLAGLVLSGCGPLEEATKEIQASFAVSDGVVDLLAASSNGRIVVLGVDDQSTVEVTATLRSVGDTLAEAAARVSKIDVQMTQNANEIVLRYEAGNHPLDVRLFSGVDFFVTVPVLSNVEADTSNGRIEARNLSGVLDLATSNGRIDTSEVTSELTASTSNGDISVENAEGLFDLRTSNGEIEMESVDGVVAADTSNGKITYSGYLAPDVDHRMATSNGRIHLAIRSDASLIIDAETSHGSITSTLPLIGDTQGDEWNAVLNPPATGTLTLRTSNGRIEMHGIL